MDSSQRATSPNCATSGRPSSSSAGLVLAALFVIFSLPSRAAAQPASWDATDQVLGATAIGALALDWSQTRYIARHREFYETNPALGRHPSTGQVDAYFASSIAAGYLLADWLTPEHRKLFLGAIAVLELSVSAHNASIGVRHDF